MNIINTREHDDDRRYTKIFSFDDTIQIGSLLEFIKQFENNETKMLVCECYTYDAEGRRAYYRAYTIDDIKSIYDKAVNPYFEYSIDFGNKETSSYSFSLVANINSKYLIYEVDKKKLANYVNKSHGNSRR